MPKVVTFVIYIRKIITKLMRNNYLVKLILLSLFNKLFMPWPSSSNSVYQTLINDSHARVFRVMYTVYNVSVMDPRQKLMYRCVVKPTKQQVNNYRI